MTITTSNGHGDLSVATETEVPGQLLHIKDMIWDGLPDDDKESFEVAFDGALAACKDKSHVWQRFMIWLLREEVWHFDDWRVAQVASLYERWVDGYLPSDDEFRDAIAAVREERGKLNQEKPGTIFYVFSTALHAAKARFQPDSAGLAAFSAAAVSRLFFNGIKRQNKDSRRSYQRQRDAMLKLLANS